MQQNKTITLLRTDSAHPAFQQLVALLDRDLQIRDGEEHGFYAQFNKIDSIKNAVLAFGEEKALACGAFKPFGEDTVEIKRMFVLPEYRGRGIAALVLDELEQWATELNYRFAVLETGLKQPEAIRLYEKNGYARIPNYGQYAGVENSVCMRKEVG